MTAHELVDQPDISENERDERTIVDKKKFVDIRKMSKQFPVVFTGDKNQPGPGVLCFQRPQHGRGMDDAAHPVIFRHDNAANGALLDAVVPSQQKPQYPDERKQTITEHSPQRMVKFDFG